MSNDTFLDRVWQGTSESWDWMRGVVLGEWEDKQSISQIVTSALAGFTPGLGSVMTLRDLLAVIVRLIRKPEKREEVTEWILLIAMLLPLIITVIGAAAAGVGALVGAELGAFLRAVALMLVKEGGVALKAIVEFFQAHGYGNVVKALQEVKFAKYQQQLVKALGDQLDKLIGLVRKVEQKLRALGPESLPHWLPGREAAMQGIANCQRFVQQAEALRKAAVDMIPKALVEMDRRLGALLAGNLKAATQVSHSVRTGKEAPEVEKLVAQNQAAQPPLAAPAAKPAAPAPLAGGQKPAVLAPKPAAARHAGGGDPGGQMLKNPKPPEPGNTRRLPERRTIALAGKREYAVLDRGGRPVGAKPHKPGETVMEFPAADIAGWRKHSVSVDEGWPNMHAEWKPGRWSEDFNTFSGELQASSLAAGSPTKLKRVVSHDAGTHADGGAFWNRDLPIDGEDLRATSAVKDSWNHDGKYVELTVPPAGHPVWKELNALQSKSAGKPVPYSEELKFWEGPASSQVYKKETDKGWVDDDWYLPGGKPQQFFDREQMGLLKERGFVSERKSTNFKDYDPEAPNATGGKGNIVPSDGPHLQVVPVDEAVKPAEKN